MNLSESHETIGIDTITLGYPIDTFPGRLDGWHYLQGQSKDGRTWERCYKTILMPSRCKLQITFYAQNVTASSNDPSISLEFSVPRVLYGNNLHPIFEVDESLNIVSRELRLIPQVPSLNMEEGLVYRIDVCKNHQVGDRLPYYIDAISRLNYPHRNTVYYLNQGVQFKADCASSKYYDKRNESKLPLAYGILRQEVTERNRKRLEELTRIQKTTIHTFTYDCIRGILTNDLNKLHLDDSIIANREFAIESLNNVYGTREGERLMKILVDRQILSKEQMMDAYGLDRSTINKAEKNINNAGISMALTNWKEPLLPIQWPYETSKNPQSPSDT